jgi:hypothetical protein
MSDGEACHETVDAQTREDCLDEAGHRCELCSAAGPAIDGTATLQVHHATRNPADMDEHDPDNLTVLCRSCHNWHHHQASGDDQPFTLTEADRAELMPHDIELLEILADIGPATTGELRDELSVDFSTVTVREHLWKLMGLDNIVTQRDEQLVDQNADSKEWGLADQVSNSARGRIPDDLQKLVQRAEDERVRRARERGCDRSTIATVFGVAPRTAWNKIARGRAYEFPLSAFESSRRRSATDEVPPEEAAGATSPAGVDDDDGQQRLADMTVSDGDDGRTNGTESTGTAPATDGGDDVNLEAHIEQAIDALEALRAAV